MNKHLNGKAAFVDGGSRGTGAAWKTKPSYRALSDGDQMILAVFQHAEAARAKPM